MADNADIVQMSDEDLLANWTTEGAASQAIRERLKVYSAEFQRRTTRAHAVARVDAMDEATRAATLSLLQEASPAGIESEEQVNNGGNE